MPSLRIASSRSRTTAAVSAWPPEPLQLRREFPLQVFRQRRQVGAFPRERCRRRGRARRRRRVGVLVRRRKRKRNPSGIRRVRRLVRNRLLQPQSLPHLPAPPRAGARARLLQSHLATRARHFSRVLRRLLGFHLQTPLLGGARLGFRLRLETRPALGFFASPPRASRALISATSARASRTRVVDSSTDRPEPPFRPSRASASRGVRASACARASRRSRAARPPTRGGRRPVGEARKRAERVGLVGGDRRRRRRASSYARLRSRPRGSESRDARNAGTSASRGDERRDSSFRRAFSAHLSSDRRGV